MSDGVLQEQSRLDALHRLSILDTGPEAFFEDIVDLVAQTVGASIAVITFIDEERQWFKAHRGLNISETPRAWSICTVTVKTSSALVVRDIAKDARFQNHPLVVGPPYGGAYLGAPIVLDCGARPGAVCAIELSPRDWSADDIALVERFARLVARHLDARRAYLERDRPQFLERALNRMQTRYASVMTAMSEGVLVQANSGAIVDFNPAACEILGLTEHDLLGRTSTDPHWRIVTQTGDDFPGDHHPPMVALRTGQQQNATMGVRTPAGELRWLHANAYPVRDPRTQEVHQVVTVFKTQDES